MRERRRKYTGNYRGKVVLGGTSFMMVGIALVFAIGLLYLSQSNSVAIKGVSLSELEAQKAQLEEDRDRLKVEAVRLQSLQEVEKALDKKDGTSDYVPVSKINYLPSSSVAVK